MQTFFVSVTYYTVHMIQYVRITIIIQCESGWYLEQKNHKKWRNMAAAEESWSFCVLYLKYHRKIYETNAKATGRQLPPFSSVLYGIISERRSVLAAQLLLREKSGA